MVHHVAKSKGPVAQVTPVINLHFIVVCHELLVTHASHGAAGKVQSHIFLFFFFLNVLYLTTHIMTRQHHGNVQVETSNVGLMSDNHASEVY